MLRRKKIFRISIIVGSIILFWIVINVLPPRKAVEDNPFIVKEGELPMIAAHRGGKANNPDNTFMAFDYAIVHNADILEMDLQLTKDEKLLINHDDSINSVTDVEKITGKTDPYIVIDHTIDEIKQFNFGYKFKNVFGEMPYVNVLDGIEKEKRYEELERLKLSAVTIDEVFEKYKFHDLKYIIEIKNSGQKGIKATQLLCKLILKYDLKKKVVVSSFHKNVEKFVHDNYPDILLGASQAAATGFIVTQLLGVNIFTFPHFSSLQIPMKVTSPITITLTKRTIVKRAHRRNISVQFWTINDKDDMRELIELGVDVIMTDNPKVLNEVYQEYKK